MKMDRNKVVKNIDRWLEKADDLQLRVIAMVVYLIIVKKS